jgi:hypothetical protein
MENQQLGEELSPEELEARRDEMKEFYEKSIPYLEAQSKYEALLTDVEEARFKRANMQVQYANMMAMAQGPDMDEEDQVQPVPKAPTKKASTSGKKLRKS